MDKSYPTESETPVREEHPVSPIPTIIITVVVFGALLASFFGGAFKGVTPAQAQQPAMLATSPLAALPTHTPAPTFTASPTRTPIPSSTPTSSPAPTATRDLGALATEQAILQHARDVQLTQDVTAQEIAWGWVKLAGVALLMVLAVVAILTAYVRSLRGDFRKPATMTHNPRVQAVQAKETNPCPLTPEEMKEWLESYSVIETLSMTQWDASGFATNHGQGKSRAMLHWLERVGLVKRDSSNSRQWASGDDAELAVLYAYSEGLTA